MFNKRTLAISLDGSEGGIEENEAPPRSVFAVLGESAKIYFNAENNIRETVPYNNHRIIKINRLNVTALDFNISREKMEELLESGVLAVEKFFEKQELPGVEAATEFLMLRDKRLSRFLSESNKNIPKISVTQECLSLAKMAARRIDDQSDKDRLLLMIVKIEAKYNIEAAKETVEKIQGSKVQSKALLEIVTVEAQDSIRGAKETAEKIQDPLVKTSALLLIAMMAKDFIEAKKIVTQIKDLTDRIYDQIKITKAEGKGDYKEIKKMASQIKNSTEKANVLLEIAKGEAKFDIKAAKETINGIKEQTLFWKTKALLAIAKEEGKGDFSYVRDCVEKIEDRGSQVTLLIHIAQAEGKGDFDSAKKKANELKGSLKVNALRDIAKAEGKGDFRSAKQNIDLILDLNYKAQVLQEIAIEEVFYTIKIAKKTAKLIQILEKKDETLRIIAFFEAKDDIEMLEKVIGQNKNSDKEDNALLKIVKAQAETNCAKAKKTVNLIQESWSKDMALKEIAVVEAKSDFEGAKQTLLLIQEESFKINALLKIAELDIKGLQQLKKDKGDNGRLLSAIKSYDHKLVEELLKSPHFNVNAKNKKSGRTGLHLSLLLKNMDAFEQLLQCQRIDVDIWDNEGNSPLYLAVKMGNDQAIDLILKRKGIERNSILGDHSLLYLAVKSKDKKLFSWLLTHHEFNRDAQDEKGRSLLHFIIEEEKEFSSLDNFQKLETSSSDDFIVPFSLNQQGNIDDTFLSHLLQDGQMNVDIQDNEGYTPLHQAMLFGNKQAIYLLLRYKGLQDFTLKNCFPLLHSAMNSKDYGLLNFCFNVLNIDVNVQDGEGCTLLHRSVINKDSVATGLILKQKKVDLSIEDNKGFTPLSLSVYFKNDLATEMLLQCRNFSDPLLPKDLLLTCVAIKFKDKMLLEWCKENTKFDVNCPDKEGLTLLQKAVIDQKIERCEMLLLLPGIDLNVVDNKGRTLLHICIENKDYASLELLLKQENIDVNLQNADGKTPIGFALMNQDMPAVSLISKHPKLKY